MSSSVFFSTSTGLCRANKIQKLIPNMDSSDKSANSYVGASGSQLSDALAQLPMDGTDVRFAELWKHWKIVAFQGGTAAH